MDCWHPAPTCSTRHALSAQQPAYDALATKAGPPALRSPAPDGVPTDEQLLRLVSTGDAASFGHFYDRHSAVLYSLALRIVGGLETAEAVLEEAMTAIWDEARAYDPALDTPLSWAIRITRRIALENLQSHNWQPVPPSVETSFAPQTGRSSGAFAKALAALPAPQRQAIELAFLGGLTQREIAAKLGHSPESIRTQIKLGMLTLRASLEGQL